MTSSTGWALATLITSLPAAGVASKVMVLVVPSQPLVSTVMTVKGSAEVMVTFSSDSITVPARYGRVMVI